MSPAATPVSAAVADGAAVADAGVADAEAPPFMPLTMSRPHAAAVFDVAAAAGTGATAGATTVVADAVAADIAPADSGAEKKPFGDMGPGSALGSNGRSSF